MSIYQQFFNRLIGWFYVLCTGRIRLEDDRFRRAMTKNVLEKVADTLQRDKLVVVLIHRHCPDAAAVLHRCGDVWWKRSYVACTAMRTRLDLCLMFSYFDFYGRDVEDLTLLMIVCFDIFENCAALGALICFVHFYVIRFFHRF